MEGRKNYSGYHQHAACGLVDVNQPVSMVFKRWPREDSFPVSRAPGGSFRRLSRFLQYFATGSDTALCQNYEEYEFVECLSEETQMIDLLSYFEKIAHMSVV